MSKTNFTKGPWVYGDASDNGQYVWDPKGERIVAEAYPDEHQDFEANAHLIAAAPEMYEAIEQTLVEIEFFGDDLHNKLHSVSLLREVLAKARGEK